MISSRCQTEIKNGGEIVRLSDVRSEIKKIIESEKLFEEKIYSVWISEEPQDVNALESSWNECMSQVEKSDIFLSIYTGEGGWAKSDGDIGICHAELETAINKEPSKVFIINALDAKSSPVENNQINDRMARYVAKINRFYNSAQDKNDIINIAKKIIAIATIHLAKMGKREARKGKYNFGEALDWTRMNFVERKCAIENEITQQFVQSGSKEKIDCVEYSFDSKKFLFKIHGIPSGMNVAAAREMVGQPFLKDHLITKSSRKNQYGPVHIIGVHKGVTEQQAINTLGHPDAVVVDGSYGVYIADKIQNIQMVFLSNCRDSASTRHNVQKFIDWLEESGEADDFFERAIRRKEILNIINKQQKSEQGAIM